MAIYSISRLGKNITVGNISDESFVLNIRFEEYCPTTQSDYNTCQTITILNKAIPAGVSETFLFTKDGKYTVLIIKDNTTIDELEYFIYEELKEAVIDSVFENFCSNCAGCCTKKDKIEILINSQSCIERILTYSLLKGYASNPVFTNYLQTSFDNYKCNFTIFERNKRNFLSFFGRNSDKYNLFGKFAIIYLVGFYLMESLEDENNTEKLYADYKISEIKSCSAEYNIIFGDLEAFFLQSVNSDGICNDAEIAAINEQIHLLWEAVNNIVLDNNLIVQYTKPEGTTGTEWLCTEDGRKYTFFNGDLPVEF